MLVVKEQEEAKSQQMEASRRRKVKSHSVGKGSETGELSWSVIDAWNEGDAIVRETTVDDDNGSQLPPQDQKSQQHLMKTSLLKDIIFESWIIKLENCQVS